MTGVEVLHRADGGRARILVVSQRSRAPHISRCTIFEFEDMIAQLDSADVVAPSPRQQVSSLQRRMAKGARRLLGMHPQRRRAAPVLGRGYEVVVVSCEDISDLLYLGPIRGWLESARLRVCYVEELWARDVPARWFETDLLREFDYVFLSCAGAVQPLVRATGVDTSFLAPSVDALGFCPGERPPERRVDVFWMGRRSAKGHAAMLRMAEERGLFYVYDTFAANQVIVPREHRLLLGNLIKRSRFFVAHRAKVDHPETEGQEELGSRHFEGAAGGAVLIGVPPSCDTFRTHFDWDDAVIPMAWDEEDPGALLDRLDAEPERLARVRARNVANMLLREDWAHRWRQVLEHIGVEPLPPLAARTAELQRMAEACPTVVAGSA